MKISSDTEEILIFLDYSTGNKLTNRNDLGTILELGALFGEDEIIQNILFNGTGIWNLHTTIEKLNSQDTGYSQILSELTKSINEFRQNITDLFGTEYPEEFGEFNNKFLSENESSRRNLLGLAHDISALKEIHIRMKENNRTKQIQIIQ